MPLGLVGKPLRVNAQQSRMNSINQACWQIGGQFSDRDSCGGRDGGLTMRVFSSHRRAPATAPGFSF
jgi:hypothetical protein